MPTSHANEISADDEKRKKWNGVRLRSDENISWCDRRHCPDCIITAGDDKGIWIIFHLHEFKNNKETAEELRVRELSDVLI